MNRKLVWILLITGLPSCAELGQTVALPSRVESYSWIEAGGGWPTETFRLDVVPLWVLVISDDIVAASSYERRILKEAASDSEQERASAILRYNHFADNLNALCDRIALARKGISPESVNSLSSIGLEQAAWRGLRTYLDEHSAKNRY